MDPPNVISKSGRKVFFTSSGCLAKKQISMTNDLVNRVHV